jgi:hypothetical protein
VANKPKLLGGLFKNIFNGVKKDEGETFFLSEEAQLRMAIKINAVLNLPFFNEEQEKAILIKIARSLDKHIYLIVPKQFLAVAFRKGEALPGDFVDALGQNLPTLLASVVPLPFLPLGLKVVVIEAFLSPLLRAMREETTLDELV